MSTAEMTVPMNQEPPRLRARLAGCFYLINIVSGASALYLSGHGLGALVGVAVLIATACYAVVTLLFLDLFAPVGATLSRVAAGVSLAGCLVGALSTLRLITTPVNGLVFFGAYCILIGTLIVRSTFMARALGVLMMIGGLGWLTFLSAPLAHRLAPYPLILGIFAESALTLWLLVMGVDDRKWREQAGARL